MVELARDEKEMLDGKHGRAKQRAMEILVRYAEALGAERFLDTNNVHLLIGFHPYPEVVTIRDGDELVSKFLLDTKSVQYHAHLYNRSGEMGTHGGTPKPARAHGGNQEVLHQDRDQHYCHLHTLPGGKRSDKGRALCLD